MASLGRSLAVPNVQALAATMDGTSEIPDRYIRQEAESEPVKCADRYELPVVDLGLLLSPEVCQEEFAKLEFACREWGFFQLINHGVPTELMQKVKEDAAEFFKLPLVEKEAVSQLPNGIEGYGQIFVASDEQKLDWADMLSIFTRPQAIRNLRFWPASPPTFRGTFDRYSVAMNEVANSLLRLMSKSLGLGPEYLMNIFREQLQAMRFNYYPPCPKSNKIKRNGRWFAIEPLPGAFIVNIGDQLEVFTNGKYKSVEHRVVTNSEKERLSVATFHSTGDNVMIGPLPELLDGGESKYKTTSRDDFLKVYFAAKLDGKNFLERMKIEK